jgi:hypothetical protein
MKNLNLTLVGSLLFSLSIPAFAGPIPFFSSEMKQDLARLLSRCTTMSPRHHLQLVDSAECKSVIQSAPSVGNLDVGKEVGTFIFPTRLEPLQKVTLEFTYENSSPAPVIEVKAFGEGNAIIAGEWYVYPSAAYTNLLEAVALIVDAHLPGFSRDTQGWNFEAQPGEVTADDSASSH